MNCWPNPGLSLDEGAIDPWTKPQYERFGVQFKKSSRGKVRSNVPYGDLAADEQALVVKAIHDAFAEVETKKYKVHVRVFLSRYRGYANCPDCKGSRLRAEALKDLAIHDLPVLTELLERVHANLAALEPTSSGSRTPE